MKILNDVSELIGRTPLVRINRLNPHREIDILAKLEGINPGGSVKDRIARTMLEDAIATQMLTRDMVLIEATSGNTGIGLAMMCAIKGYTCEVVMPESASKERREIIEAYGAHVTLTPAELGIDGARKYVEQQIGKHPFRYFSPNQYDNAANWMTHYDTTAKEILEDTDEKITHFVAGLGTSGTLMGVGKKLKEFDPWIQIVSIEPESPSHIEGLKDLKMHSTPRILDESLIDMRIRVDDHAARNAAMQLAMQEGIFAGHSAGAAMVGALKVIEDLHMREVGNAVVVVLLADSGYKYLSRKLFSPELAGVSISDCTKRNNTLGCQ